MALQRFSLRMVIQHKVISSVLNAHHLLQGPAFGTSASVYDKQRVVATASGPTFATEDRTVHILLLTGALCSLSSRLGLVPSVYFTCLMLHFWP